MGRFIDRLRRPTADNTANSFMNQVVGNKSDAAAAGAVSTTETLMAYLKQCVTESIARDVVVAGLPNCIVKSDGAILAGLDPIFTITGGPIRAKIVGLVTTVVGGASNGRLQHITTAPEATVNLNAGAVAIDADAVGTFYYNVGASSVFTPSSGLGFKIQDPVTVEETDFLLAPGVVQFLSSAARSGVIAWYMTYEPLSPDSVVVAAA